MRFTWVTLHRVGTLATMVGLCYALYDHHVLAEKIAALEAEKPLARAGSPVSGTSLPAREPTTISGFFRRMSLRTKYFAPPFPTGIVTTFRELASSLIIMVDGNSQSARGTERGGYFFSWRAARRPRNSIVGGMKRPLTVSTIGTTDAWTCLLA